MALVRCPDVAGTFVLAPGVSFFDFSLNRGGVARIRHALMWWLDKPTCNAIIPASLSGCQVSMLQRVAKHRGSIVRRQDLCNASRLCSLSSDATRDCSHCLASSAWL